jgi:phospholipid/cholesterol/gamma-HCH transport system substrate-binding protein
VRISGIKVGSIESATLDPKTFQAIVKLSIEKTVQLPVDSVATITSSGLLGDKFLQLVPGADDKIIEPGGRIRFTQPPVNLEALLGQYVFSTSSTSKPAADAPPPSGPAPSEPSTPQPTTPQPSHDPARK